MQRWEGLRKGAEVVVNQWRKLAGSGTLAHGANKSGRLVMVFDKVCPCGKEFHALAPATKFCSVGCNPRARTKVVCVCPECGREFGRGRKEQVYCSGVCKNRMYNRVHDIAGRLRARRA